MAFIMFLAPEGLEVSPICATFGGSGHCDTDNLPGSGESPW